MIKQYIIEHNLWSRIKLIRNSERRGALANVYKAVKQCKDYEIVIKIDGDDWLKTPMALARVNDAYTNTNVWLTYGQFQFYPHDTPGYCGEIRVDLATIRQQCGLATHLCTFYAGLFKRIAKKDLMYNDAFFSVTSDKAIMAPMLEMAYGRWEFIQDILYVYNFTNPLSDAALHGEEQVKMRDYIMKMPAYQPLQMDLPFERARADMVIFSYDRPLQLFALLESTEKYVAGLGHIIVIYRTSNERYDEAYTRVKARFGNVEFKKQSVSAHADFKQLTIDSSLSTPNSHIIYAVDDIIVKDFVDISECIYLLEKHKAYGFYLRLGKNLTECYSQGSCPQRVPRSKKVKHNVYAWQFSDSEHDWHYPNTVDMTLYRKKDISSFLANLPYSTPNTLEGEWAAYGYHVITRFGLYYKRSKIVNLPLNRVGEFGNRNMNFMQPAEMLSFFEEGKKIDIRPLFQMHNRGAHTAYVPTFIEREGAEKHHEK